MSDRAAIQKLLPACPGCALSQRAPVLVGRDSWELPAFGSLLPPWLRLGSGADALAVTRHHRLPATCQDWGSAAAWPRAPCSVPAFAHVTRSWHTVKPRGLGRRFAGLASELQFLEYVWVIRKAVVLVMSIEINVWMAGGSFTHLGKTFINYYLKARGFLKIHCILPRLTFSCILLWQVESWIGCGLYQNLKKTKKLSFQC